VVPVQIVRCGGDETGSISRFRMKAHPLENFIDSSWLCKEAGLEASESIAHRQRTSIELPGGNLTRMIPVIEHIDAVCRQRQLQQIASKTTARFNESEETLGRQLKPSEHPRHQQNDLTREPMIAVREEEAIDC